MTNQEYRGNMNYPFQDHIVLNVEENVVPFPRTNLRKCQHAQVEIDTKALELTCMKCGAKVNPVMWIKDTMKYWSRQQTKITEQKKQISEDLDELKKRARTKCQHCNKMTAINLKNLKFTVIG
ncbi:hypothetical protein [Acinetobacter baumannii]|uniref:Phage-like protein n=2 Tax=Acinetobacter baumannii TaxID=470 RepID=A0A290UEG7_ACIBA|nr:hypothetical protein [Acinetobacter baumannii]QJS52940.1 hypothetical protein phiAb1151011551_00059 [Acinetobacter phage Ab11510-phi]ATD18444.1 hypothetical protein BS098_00095 [Acinetobacter baumannii]ATD20505.1 hypothetical protein BS098_11665 [Acinetobacter baumannii]AXG85833.1 hypothetical protein Aba810CP_14115 [Acinetobacter baumannii]EIR6368701.1 hypothetical protein [Acinetobacter baumannii]